MINTSKWSIILFLFVSIIFRAQEVITIESDRPDQSEGVSTLPYRAVQMEAGVQFSKGSWESESMLRLGIANKAEMRMSANTFFQKSLGMELSSIIFSSKYALVENKGWRPAVTLVGYVSFAPQSIGRPYPDLALAFRNSITDQLTFDYNIGSVDGFDKMFSTTLISYDPWSKLSLFLEHYAHYESQRHAKHHWDFGIMYLISSKFQADVVVGNTLFAEDDWYLGLGLSYLIAR